MQIGGGGLEHAVKAVTLGLLLEEVGQTHLLAPGLIVVVVAGVDDQYGGVEVGGVPDAAEKQLHHRLLRVCGRGVGGGKSVMLCGTHSERIQHPADAFGLLVHVEIRFFKGYISREHHLIHRKAFQQAEQLHIFLLRELVYELSVPVHGVDRI